MGSPISQVTLSWSWVESDPPHGKRIDYPEVLRMVFTNRASVYMCALDYSNGTILPLADSVLVVFGDVTAQRLGLVSEEPNSDSLKLENRSLGHYPSGGWWTCLNGKRQPFEADLRSALPLLELAWPEIESKLSWFPEKARKGFPVQLLISYALNWPTEYWRELALAWLEKGACEMDDDMSELLGSLMTNADTQSSRHRAKELLRDSPYGKAHTVVAEVLGRARGYGLSEFPEDARTLLVKCAAPPRLVAHLVLVHDVAAQLLAGLESLLTKVNVDIDAVRFGAATHDVGKATQSSELIAPGKVHEGTGETLILQHGIEARLARFARTHGYDPNDTRLELSDLLVILADKCWKGKRAEELEERIAKELTNATGSDYWDVHMHLSDLVERISDGASDRLDWQNRFSTE